MFFTKGNAFHVFSQWKVGIETKKRSISKEIYITRVVTESLMKLMNTNSIANSS